MAKIKLAICLDDKQGMLFFGKRQSRDRVLIEDFIRTASGAEVLINSFSKLLFSDYENVRICEDPLGEACEDNFCFIENLKLAPYVEDIDTLIVYRWNRSYPTDMKLDININDCGFRLYSSKDFKGSSHDKITKEIYKR